ncbi:DUF6452 family protein [Chitinophaga lutea]|nr:DUF6452 family protein [Chitinophaga lutea]
MKHFLLIAALVAGLVACDDETKVCDTDTRTELRASFVYFKDSSDMQHDTVFRKVSFGALGKDSIYRRQPGLRGLQFQLDRVSDSARFFFQTDSTAAVDTITFRYRRQPHFVSAGCGVVMYFNLDTVFSTRRVIRSITIHQPAITTVNEKNITLHF